MRRKDPNARRDQLPRLLPFRRPQIFLLFTIAEGEHREDSFNLQLQTPGQQVSFIFYPTHPLHYLFYLLTGQSRPSHKNRERWMGILRREGHTPKTPKTKPKAKTEESAPQTLLTPKHGSIYRSWQASSLSPNRRI